MYGVSGGSLTAQQLAAFFITRVALLLCASIDVMGRGLEKEHVSY